MPGRATRSFAESTGSEWELPTILKITTRRLSFESHTKGHSKLILSDYQEAVEFLVCTRAPIPHRKPGPALFVGDLKVSRFWQLELNHYQFITFEVDRLEPDVPIGWGWVDTPVEERKKTEFRFAFESS